MFVKNNERPVEIVRCIAWGKEDKLADLVLDTEMYGSTMAANDFLSVLGISEVSCLEGDYVGCFSYLDDSLEFAYYDSACEGHAEIFLSKLPISAVIIDSTQACVSIGTGLATTTENMEVSL